MPLKRLPIKKNTRLWRALREHRWLAFVIFLSSYLGCFLGAMGLAQAQSYAYDPVKSRAKPAPNTVLNIIDEQVLVFTAQALEAGLLSESVKITSSEMTRFSAKRAIAGHPIEHYLLTAYTANGLQVIPLQIDERERDDFSAQLSEQETEPVKRPGKDNVAQQSTSSAPVNVAGVFDAFDELLLAPADLGIAMPETTLKTQASGPLSTWLLAHHKAVFELRIPHTGAKGEEYAYLWVLHQPAPGRYQSIEDRVSYDVQTYFAETDHFSLAAALDNPLVWQDVRFQGWPASPGSFLDTLKIRLTGNTLANTSAITITNKNLRARVTSVTDGALRATVDVQTNMVIAGMPVMRWMIEMQFYPKSVLMRLRSRTSPWVSWLLADTALSISFDGVALKGARIRASGTPVEVGIVDGKRSAVEALLAETGFASDEKWWVLRQPDHLRLFAHLHIERPAETAVSMIYEDDAQLKIAPERYAGQAPNIGFKIERFPLKTPLALQLWMRMDAPEAMTPVAHFLEHLSARPPIRVRALDLKGVQ